MVVRGSMGGSRVVVQDMARAVRGTDDLAGFRPRTWVEGRWYVNLPSAT